MTREREIVDKLKEAIGELEKYKKDINFLNQKVIILEKQLEKQKSVTYGLLKDKQRQTNNKAIKESESLENRSCDNCVYLKIESFRNYETATCKNEKCDEMFDCNVGNDFCCNKWESK